MTRKTTGAWIERIAAVIGALAVLAGAWNWLTARPEISLTGPQYVDVLAGDPLALELIVANRADTDARITLSSASPGDTLDPGSLDLDPRQQVTVKVRGTASGAGEQFMILSARASAGWLRQSVTVTHRVKRRDWPAIATSEPVAVMKVDTPRSARLRTSIRTGAAQATGLRCLAVARLPSSATFVGVSPAETHENPRRNGEHANEAVSLVWLTQPTRAFESTPLTFYLETDDDWDLPRWDALASRTNVTCERR